MHREEPQDPRGRGGTHNICDAPKQEEEASEGDRVRRDEPLQVGRLDVEVGPDRRQGELDRLDLHDLRGQQG